MLGGSEEDTGGRAGNGGGVAGGQAIQVQQVDDFDPYGSSGEHPEEVDFAADGDGATAWSTQTYDASFETYPKPGVGLVFDLGSPQEVAAVELESPDADYDVELRAADSFGADENAFSVVDEADDVSSSETLEDFEPATYRYWLVWITSLPGGGAGSMALSEVTFLAP